MNHPSVIDSFSGRWRFLSNFYPSPIRHGGIDYATVEHAYQCCKTLDFELRQIGASMITPGLVKQWGRNLPRRDDWEEVKVGYMRTMLRKKFAIPELASRLRETGSARLIEGNTWGDRFWGECPVGTGKNMLGILLMERRSLL